MLKNYFITSYRNLLRNKVYAFLNVFGLTLGISCFCLIMLYVENELSYDQFHSENFYRFLYEEQTGDGETRKFGIISVKTLEEFPEKIAGIEDVLLARNHGAGPLLVAYKDVRFKTRDLFFTEADFFDYFNFKLLQGNPATALAGPNDVVITESMAKKIFGDANPMGETIKFSGTMGFTLQVTGVVEDPKNSHVDFEFLVNFEVRDEINDYLVMREGFAGSVYGYFKLAPNTDPDDASKLIKQHYLDYYKDRPDVVEALARENYEFQSIQDIYFNSNDVSFDEGFNKGNKQNILILGVIGAFVLLIACMNYINAATAKAATRSKEIGVRKVFGAFKKQLIVQFLGEAFLVSFVAVVLSVLVTDLTLPAFENLMETELRFSLINNPLFLKMLVSVLVGVTLLSGLYPALVLSRFRPSESLRSQNAKGFLRGAGLRNFLVGIQLFFTLVLVSSVLLIVQQSRFINSKDLGFSKDDILIIPNNSPKVGAQLATFKSELLKSPYILGATTGVDVLGFETTNNSGPVLLEGQSYKDAPVATFFTVGDEFIQLQELELINGRTFNPYLKSDTASIVVNEAFVRANGLEDIVGKKARLWGADGVPVSIIGVVKDFNFKSLRSKVSPAIFMLNSRMNWFWTLKVDPTHKAEAVNHARTVWDKVEPEYPMGYWFLEDNLQAYYAKEKRLESAIKTFSVICLVISCLGLYGMTTFTIERRIKEIGIRKVLGAGVNQLVWVVNSKFVWLFVIAFLVSVPLVYYAIDQWLEGFAYHINIGATSFLLAGALVLVIILLTVSVQAVKAAWSNPASTLRAE
ncbi:MULTISPECIES: ABC transporter permease [Roseivirga]|nr:MULTISPECIES: ABC transporter permease [Roseivirga]MBO6659590.1 ABC transporter permease [Roseivirga sp.]MBO6761394.1 ABC transporter permease [Roseivirga sp.]MBO6907673.1 ABC transporter permease [Roseivirga sp.]WPZ10043.1 FtsX-like permease family protein [Roseivirga spongicola]